jgi:hypothetical protein
VAGMGEMRGAYRLLVGRHVLSSDFIGLNFLSLRII